MVHAVRVGYRVLDHQIDRGRNAAEQLRQAYDRTGGKPENIVQDGYAIANKAMQLMVEWMENGLRSPSIARGLMDRYGVLAGAGSSGETGREELGDAFAAIVESLGLTVMPRASAAPRAPDNPSTSATTTTPASAELRLKMIVRTGENYCEWVCRSIAAPGSGAIVCMTSDGTPNPMHGAKATFDSDVLTIEVDASKAAAGEYQSIVAEATADGGPIARLTLRVSGIPPTDLVVDTAAAAR